MAQQWPECTVVGLDIAPIQTDLAALARAQALVGVQEAEDGEMAVDWEDLSKRVVWKIGNLSVNRSPVCGLRLEKLIYHGSGVVWKDFLSIPSLLTTSTCVS
jgi:hypothetical protein